MPRVKPEARIRAKKPKTRTGCRTCKARRVKCDEVRPECRRCTSTGRRCEGYDDIFVDAFAASYQHPQLTFRNPRSPGTSRELRAVSFFRERTAPQIAGFYDNDFWTSVILAASHENVALRHAVVALAAIHEDFEVSRVADSDRAKFALGQYHKAIQKHLEVVGSGQKATLDNYLAPCMVFMCIEMLQRHFGSAVSLAMRAVTMFYDATTEEQQASAWPIELLESILGRLQTQTIGLVGVISHGRVSPPNPTAIVLRGIPDRFSSVTEARDHLDFYYNSYVLSMVASLGEPETAKQVRDGLAIGIADIFARWTHAFDELLSSSGDAMTERDKNAATILQMRRLMLITAIDSGERQVLEGPEYEDRWGEYDTIFGQVVDLAETVVQSMRGAEVGETRKFSFTLDWGIVGPLYDAARRARHPIIRRKAIRLLYENPCQEGMWDSVLAARVAERVMELEERSLRDGETLADVPENDRISDVIPVFDLDGRTASVTYCQYERDSIPLVVKKKLMEEVIHW